MNALSSVPVILGFRQRTGYYLNDLFSDDKYWDTDHFTVLVTSTKKLRCMYHD